MSPKTRPTNCFLNNLECLGVRDGKKVWRSPDGLRLYTWDSQHGEVEVYNRRGFHLGVADAVSGEVFKPAVRGRKIDV
jgi:hypothetical protein